MYVLPFSRDYLAEVASLFREASRSEHDSGLAEIYVGRSLKLFREAGM